MCADEDPVYIVMEFMPGGSLLDFLRKRGSQQTKKKLCGMCVDACRVCGRGSRGVWLQGGCGSRGVWLQGVKMGLANSCYRILQFAGWLEECKLQAAKSKYS